MTTARYRSLLRTVYASIVSSRLTPGEIRALSDELRRGQLADELAYMLSRAASHFGAAEEDDDDDDRIVEAEELVKSNKISRASLMNILGSLGYSPSSSRESTREMLRRFLGSASSSSISKLIDILKANKTGDRFLAGINQGRK